MEAHWKHTGNFPSMGYLDIFLFAWLHLYKLLVYSNISPALAQVISDSLEVATLTASTDDFPVGIDIVLASIEPHSDVMDVEPTLKRRLIPSYTYRTFLRRMVRNGFKRKTQITIVW